MVPTGLYFGLPLQPRRPWSAPRIVGKRRPTAPPSVVISASSLTMSFVFRFTAGSVRLTVVHRTANANFVESVTRLRCIVPCPPISRAVLGFAGVALAPACHEGIDPARRATYGSVLRHQHNPLPVVRDAESECPSSSVMALPANRGPGSAVMNAPISPLSFCAIE